MEPDKKELFSMMLVFLLFALAITSLAFSGLSVNRALSMENDVTGVFLKSAQTSIAAAIFDSGVFILQNAVIPMLPFLVFSALGFFAILFFRVEAKKLAVASAAVLALTAAYVLALAQSPALMIIPLGFIVPILPLEFEERRSAFRTGYAFVSRMIHYLNIFLALAIFTAIFILPDFDKVAEEQMISSVGALLPDAGQLQQAQSGIASNFINQASASVKNIIDNEYSSLPSGKQTECSQFKDSVKIDVESYRTQLITQLQSGNSSIGTEQLAKDVFSKISLFSAIAKALPLIAALALFALLELIKPLFAAIGGIAYHLAAGKSGK